MQNVMDGMQNTIVNQQSHIDSLESKGIYLEDRCELLQRSIQMLSKESTWEYSAPSIHDNYWIGLGFDEEYIESMDELVTNIRNTSTFSRNGECTGDVSLGVASPDNDVGTLLQHDDVLLPHWKEFATALQLSPGKTI